MKNVLNVNNNKLTPSEFKAKYNRFHDKNKIKRLDMPVLLKQIFVIENVPQKEALKAIRDAWGKQKSEGIIVLPSGTGKTLLIVFLTKEGFNKILFIAHRDHILNQTKKEFKRGQNITDDDVGFYRANEKNLNKKITLAMIQTLNKKDNLSRIPKDLFDIIIVDECHHAAAKTYLSVLNHFKPKYLIGMTATPYRLDDRSENKRHKVEKVFGDNVFYESDIQKEIERGQLVPFIYYVFDDDIHYPIHYKGHNYPEKNLNKKLLIPERDNQVVREFKKLIGSRQTIGFCNSIKHLERTVRLFNNAGIKSAGIIHKMKPETKQEIIARFEDKKYQVLFTIDILNEGIDVPSIGGLLFIRRTDSKRLWMQQLGRGLRIMIGKKDVIVLDFIHNYTNAYKKQRWLEKIFPKGVGKPGKPECVHYVPEVHFTKRFIDIFELMKPVTLEKFKEEYKRFKDDHDGRVPTMKEFKYSYMVKKYYRSWNDFIRKMGDEVNKEMNIPKERAIKEYKRLRKKLGRAPKAKEFRYRLLVQKHYGSWNKFVTAMGDDANKEMNIPKEKAIKEYKELRGKLGRPPSKKEFEKEYKHTGPIKRDYSNWTNFVIAIGDEPYFEKNIPKEILIEEYKELRDKLGRPPSKKEFVKEYKHKGPIRRHYGNWTNFQKEMGDEPLHEMNIPKEILIEEYKELRDKLGRPPSKKEFVKEYKHKGPIRRHYGNWTNFVIAMGDKLRKTGERKKKKVKHN